VSWIKLNWLWLLIAAAAVNFSILLYVPLWLSKKLGCAIKLPDVTAFFSDEKGAALKDCLFVQGQVGLDLFGRLHTFGADLVFPALFAAALTFGTLHLARKAPRFSKYPTKLTVAFCAFMPVAYAVCDYLENAMVWNWLSSNLPNLTTTSIMLVTTLKFFFVADAFAIFILFALGKLKQRDSI
jgi:hypothetical protein